MSADRGAFICQSLNLFMENPSFSKLSSMQFYGWQKGLKTGMYYLRSKAAVDPIKFTLSQKYQQKFVQDLEEGSMVESMQDPIEASLIPEPVSSMVEQKNKQAGVAMINSNQAYTTEEIKACRIDDPECLMCGS